MRQESGFNPQARSYKGAMGLMQLMPATARRFGVNNVYDPAENIEGGAKYLRFLLDKFDGDVKLVLAGYNAGEGAVVNYGYTVPPYRETRNYVKNISARYGSDKHVVKNQKTAAAPRAPEAIKSASRLSNNY
jgi:soluble lytic murein transglycosylase-like protein